MTLIGYINPMYPKRIVNLSCVVLLVLASLVAFSKLNQLSSEFHNLNTLDIILYALSIVIEVSLVVSCFAAIMKKKWSWYIIAGYPLYSIITYFFYYYQNKLEYSIGLVFGVGLVLVAFFSFFITADVRAYFQVKGNYKKYFFLIPILVAYIVNLDPAIESSSVNANYVTLLHDQVVFRGSAFSGTLYSNHSNGNLKFEGEMNNGYQVGEWITYYDDGNIQNKVSYIDGYANGKDITYFRSGGVREEMYYKMDTLDGLYTLWISPGEISKSGMYMHDKKHGDWKVYDNDSLYTYHYLDGELQYVE